MESMMDIDSHLTQLLGNMTLDSRWHKTVFESERPDLRSPTPEHDALMSDSSDTEDPTYQRPSTLASSSSIETASAPPPCACALVQALRGLVHAGQYPTTGGEYLEAIFTHREAFAAFPQGHRACAVEFSNLATDLERREMRADRDGDGEAAAAFRHEAWVLWSSIQSNS
ncbi:uncharacterized protein FIBRA_08731 [Fibroporia radiculosa]|uniref:UBZ2-type domain-containing protein n=1 Tax=Fibroporia radiculosa TaxID=599839 RepID=J4ICI4_9APHY|nr:uncharacterized protein FIBRA_08731 [Fibroporia radiculosa]CCM06466.1 predicted protein [Fibroporia radiculosa]